MKFKKKVCQINLNFHSSAFGKLAFKVKSHITLVNSIHNLSPQPILILQTDALEPFGSLVVIGKVLETIIVETSTSTKTIKAIPTILRVGNAKGTIVDFDVNDPIKKIVLHFSQNIIDDYSIEFEYKKKS